MTNPMIIPTIQSFPPSVHILPVLWQCAHVTSRVVQHKLVSNIEQFAL